MVGRPLSVPDGLIDAARGHDRTLERTLDAVEEREELEAERDALLLRHQKERQDQSSNHSRRGQELHKQHENEMMEVMNARREPGNSMERMKMNQVAENQRQARQFTLERQDLSAKQVKEKTNLERRLNKGTPASEYGLYTL